MTLGLFLAIGESLTDFKQKGQLKRLLDYNIKKYSQNFDKVYIFSYANERGFPLPRNCHLIANTSDLHRYIYAIALPIIKRSQITDCDVFRGLQLTGGIPASLAKILFGKKFVINFGYDYAKIAKIEGKILQFLFYKLVKKPILALADKIIVTSSEIKNLLAKDIQKNKIAYIPNGVDLKLFRPLPQKTSSKLLKIIFLGRLEKQKNLDSLIMAISQARTRTLKLILYGNGPLGNYLLRLARKLSVDLKIRSPVDYQKIPQVMSLADIFVLPSLEEGNPKILLEAMACQKAVIGSNVKGTNEIIINNYNGFLTGTDSQSIAEALKKLENKWLREKLGENARKYIVENYEIDKLLDIEVDLLKKVAIAR